MAPELFQEPGIKTKYHNKDAPVALITKEITGV